MVYNVKTLIVAGVVATAGCSSQVARIRTAPGTVVVPGIGEGASASAAGVRVIARAQAWQWEPRNLSTEVTPFLIELRNDGSHPVLVRYNRISLTDADGHRFMVMPPYDIDGSVTERYTVMNPYYGFNGFAVAPYLSRWYPRFTRYSGVFAYDPAYYTPYITQYRNIELPTADMVQRALPEGVLSPGGSAAGFVYFQALHSDARTLTLSVEMVDAVDGRSLGTATIPFVTN
jgi:hypothetical protein